MSLQQHKDWWRMVIGCFGVTLGLAGGIIAAIYLFLSMIKIGKFLSAFL